MKFPHRFPKFLLVSLLCLVSVSAISCISLPMASGLHDVADQVKESTILAHHRRLPLSFEINRGQAAAQVKFLARGQGYTLFLTAAEAVLALHTPVVVSNTHFLRKNRGVPKATTRAQEAGSGIAKMVK
jgi:cytochrome c biogenesis protein ResB